MAEHFCSERVHAWVEAYRATKPHCLNVDYGLLAWIEENVVIPIVIPYEKFTKPLMNQESDNG